MPDFEQSCLQTRECAWKHTVEKSLANATCVILNKVASRLERVPKCEFSECAQVWIAACENSHRTNYRLGIVNNFLHAKFKLIPMLHTILSQVIALQKPLEFDTESMNHIHIPNFGWRVQKMYMELNLNNGRRNCVHQNNYNSAKLW